MDPILVVVVREICPIIGRVGMNITSVDISKVKNPRLGEEVIVYSNNSTHPNSIAKVADMCDTIAHEILVHKSPATRRVVVD